MLTRGFVGSLCLLVGGVLTAVLPRSAWLAGQPEVVHLRATGVGSVLVVVGLVVLTVEWLSLCRHAAASRGDAVAEAVGLVRHATLVWCAPLVVAPPLFSLDGWAYAAQGMLWHLGISPYEHGPGVLQGPVVEAVDPRWLFTPTPYGPVPVVLGALAAGLTGNPWILVVAHGRSRCRAWPCWRGRCRAWLPGPAPTPPSPRRSCWRRRSCSCTGWAGSTTTSSWSA